MDDVANRLDVVEKLLDELPKSANAESEVDTQQYRDTDLNSNTGNEYLPDNAYSSGNILDFLTIDQASIQATFSRDSVNSEDEEENVDLQDDNFPLEEMSPATDTPGTIIYYLESLLIFIRHSICCFFFSTFQYYFTMTFQIPALICLRGTNVKK